MMSGEFEMSMIGELTMFLGFQIKQLKDGIFIHQEKYIHDLLKHFGMEDCKEIKTPMASNGQLETDLQGKPVDQKLYRSMIGSLLYLTASRPDIMFSMCMCARYQANPKESHEKAVREFLDTLDTLLVLACGIPKVLTSSCLAIPIRILPGVKLTERAQRGDANYLGDIWYLGVLRNKILLLYQPPKLNILPSELVALKF